MTDYPEFPSKVSEIDPGRLYRVADIAFALDLNYISVMRIIKRGEMKTVKIGRTKKLLGQDVIDYVFRERK